MTAATHTPAPWSITEHSWSRTGIYAGEVQVAMIDIYSEATEDNQADLEARSKANARLIAAAPALLEAIKNLLEAQDAVDNREYSGQNAEDYFVLMRRRNAKRVDLDAAIAKATGSAA